MKKRYDQYCAVCHALGLVGERWALLVVRELLKGPKRYTDLLEGMPGIGTNILAARLRELEEGGVVRKRKLPPPAASTVYELTEYGQELEEPLYALARWGARTLPPPAEEDFYPDWGLNAFPALLDPQAARGLTATYVVRVADDVFTVRLEDNSIHVGIGAAENPDLDFSTDRETFFGLASGQLDPRVALAGGTVTIESGKPADLKRFFSVFNLTQRQLISA
ncbi:MAG TPA: winged helix-turn-helix transcriptional regulator [Gaiellaceae bacterium]|nr:winged helix-turn-helix transcriptional regulator [Gaiellaceae bacterium]